MNSRLTRVGQFLRSIDGGILSEGQKSIILSTEGIMDGAGENELCKNSSEACEGQNVGCTNYGNACNEGSNKNGCTNTGMDKYQFCGGSTPNSPGPCGSSGLVYSEPCGK